MRIIPIGRMTAGKYRSKVAKLGECYGAAHFILTVRGCAALAAAGTTPGSGTTTWGIASPAASLVKQLSPVRCQLSPVVGWILPCEIARGCSLRPVRAAAVFAPSPPAPLPAVAMAGGVVGWAGRGECVDGDWGDDREWEDDANRSFVGHDFAAGAESVSPLPRQPFAVSSHSRSKLPSPTLTHPAAGITMRVSFLASPTNHLSVGRMGNGRTAESDKNRPNLWTSPF